MKILTASQIRKVDALTIEQEPVSSINLMERASGACADWIAAHFDRHRSMAVFAGTGNNGGDGLAIARLLHRMQYSVSVYMLAGYDRLSPDARVNYQRLVSDSEGCSCAEPAILTENSMPVLHPSAVIIDALFGTGFTPSKPRNTDRLTALAVNHINSSGCTVASIDMPSGMSCDDNRRNDPAMTVRAHHTLTFQQPKLSFMFAENAQFTGEWTVLDIGLLPSAIEQQESKYFTLHQQDIAAYFTPREKHAHKGNFGHACIIAGSRGMMGACVLASKACLRAGAGLVTAHIPHSERAIMQTAVPEATLSLDENPSIPPYTPDPDRYTAIAAGPGTGTGHTAEHTLVSMLEAVRRSMTCPETVLDADALNIIARNKKYMDLLPRNAILTPHPKEFDRLADRSDTGYARHLRQMEFAREHSVYVVLKGAYTSIATPDGHCMFNTTGNPGMATAGSGDVLTGIIVSLLAQGLTPLRAACAGVWLHGRAGDLAADRHSQQAMTAGDIIDCMGAAFKSIL